MSALPIVGGPMLIAGIALVTIPSITMPPIEWRVHFGVAIWCLGVASGIGIGAVLQLHFLR